MNTPSRPDLYPGRYARSTYSVDRLVLALVFAGLLRGLAHLDAVGHPVTDLPGDIPDAPAMIVAMWPTCVAADSVSSCTVSLRRSNFPTMCFASQAAVFCRSTITPGGVSDETRPGGSANVKIFPHTEPICLKKPPVL